MGVQLPADYQRVADAFTDLPADRKEAVLGQLRGVPDAAALDKTVNQIIRNGGPEAELVGRIFQRNVNPASEKGKEPGGIRTVHNKKLEPIQRKDAGTGAAGAGHIPHDEPHTSTANPPVSGHPGKTENQE